MIALEVKGYVPIDEVARLCHARCMTGTIYERISARAKELGLSLTKVATHAGLNAGYLKDVKAGTNPTAKNVERIAGVLGVSTAWLISGDESTKVERQPELPVVKTPVVGIIEAGNFRDVTIRNQDEDHPRIPVAQNELFPDLTQYALEVKGDSMNRVVLEDTYVICVPFAQTRLSPRPGMIVHVERMIGGGQLVETTLKEVEEIGGQLWLAPRSTNPVHKPIPIEGDDATEIHIRGLVTSLWKPLRKRW